jgi:hypothetical protein
MDRSQQHGGPPTPVGAAGELTKPAPGGRAFQIAFLLCAGVALLPLWVGTYLPFVDYPQHLAQLDLWQKMADPHWPWRDQFRVDLFTPYLIVYCLARALGGLLAHDTGLRVLLSLYVVGLPLITAWLLRRLDQTVWLALLVFPAAYGFSMTFGLLNYTFSVPLGLLAIAVAVRPRQRSGPWLLAPLLLLLSFSHVLVWAVASACCGLLYLRLLPDWRAMVKPALALAAPVPLVLLWMHLTHGNDPVTIQENVWAHGPHIRFGLLPRYIVGQATQHAPSAIYGLMLLLAPYAMGRSVDVRSPAVAPLLLVLAAYMVLPTTLWGVWGVSERFSVFVLPLWLASTRSTGRLPRHAPWLLLVLVLPWLGYLVSDAQRFDERASEFEAVIELMQPGKRALGVSGDVWLDEPRGPALEHLGCWYQMRAGGIWEPSFAHYFSEVVQFADIDAAVTRQQTRSLGDRGYDYYVVSGFPDVSGWADDATLAELRLVHDTGTWQLWAPIAR